jgi:hypothetical protein
MSSKKEYRQQADEAAARIEWCEKKLSFERKRRRALEDLAEGDDWLDGKISPVAEPQGANVAGRGNEACRPSPRK